MLTPVHEAIVQAMADRLSFAAGPDGSPITEVIRRRRGETPGYVGGTVELWTGDITDLDGSSHQGVHFREQQFTVDVAVFVDAPESDPTPADTLVANAVAYVHNAMGIEDRFGLCNTIFLSSVSYFPPDPGQAAGARLTYTITFDWSETDITQGRSA